MPLGDRTTSLPNLLRLVLACLAVLATSSFAQPLPMRELRLIDHRGLPVDAAALAGRPVLLHFVFTTCSTICPTQVLTLSELRRSLPADVQQRLSFVSVTVDPLQDTPASLASFARRQGADLPGWHFVTGPPAQVHALLDRMQALAPQDPSPENHRTSLYLYNARGDLLQRYGGAPIDRARLLVELTQVSRDRRR